MTSLLDALSKLPAHKASGSMITSPGDQRLYATWFCCSLIGFALYTFLMKSFFDVTQAKDSYYKTRGYFDRNKFLQTLTANTHHIMLVSFAVWNLYTPDCQGSYPLQWFKDDVCFLTVDVRYGCAGCLMMGYLVQDYIFDKLFLVGDKMSFQMAVHHIVATASTALALYAGYGMNGICNMLYLMEFSTPSLNYRSLYEKKDFGKCMPQMLQMLFFFQFTVFRIVLMPFAYYKLSTMYPEVVEAMP